MNTQKLAKIILSARRIIIFMMIACFLATTSPLIAYGMLPAAPHIPPPAKPANVKKGPKGVKVFEPKLVLSTNPADAELSKARVFIDSLVPMHSEPVPGENVALGKALLAFRGKTDRQDVSDLTNFIAQFPKSRWRPSLEVNLGIRRLEDGYLTDALDCFKSAWTAAKGETSKPQKVIADQAVGRLVLLEAALGQKNELESYLAEIKKRPLYGAMDEKVRAARKALGVMKSNPAVAYKCGPHALNSVLSALSGKPVHSPLMFKAQSTDTGTNLAQLKDWADQLGLHYQIAKRSQGAPILLPSVMHWAVGHFAAIMQKDNDRYRTKDPTFANAGNIALTEAAIDSQSDGYFLVPDGPLPKGWRSVTKEEAQSVWGKGYGVPGCPKDCGQKMQSMGPGSGGCCTGLANASAWAQQGTLHIEDTPLSYHPPIGPNIDFHITYNFDEDFDVTDCTNLGSNSRLNWVSYLTLDDSDNATVVLGGGGSDYYAYPYEPSLYNQSQLVNVSEGVYQRQLPDGTVQLFNQADGSGRIFMTEVTDPQGNSVTITYDDNFRVTAVTDAIGQESTITYSSDSEDAPGFYLPSEITDPFSRSCSFTYDEDYTVLMSITDVIGLTSQFQYSADSDQIGE